MLLLTQLELLYVYPRKWMVLTNLIIRFKYQDFCLNNCIFHNYQIQMKKVGCNERTEMENQTNLQSYNSNSNSMTRCYCCCKFFLNPEVADCMACTNSPHLLFIVSLIRLPSDITGLYNCSRSNRRPFFLFFFNCTAIPGTVKRGHQHLAS